MATNTNYKDFEDDVIKELKRQLRPSVSDIIIEGIFGSFLGVGGVGADESSRKFHIIHKRWIVERTFS